jgi:putative nucleotidyltransferase with HDIG domain
MPDKPTDPTVPRQIELAILRLESLSILPSVAAQCFTKLLNGQPETIAETIEADPALAAKVLSAARQQQIASAEALCSFKDAIERMPLNIVRDAVFSVKLYPAFDQNGGRALLRRQLILHSLAVACCAEDIAKIASPTVEPQLAYAAGLLHDIGKLALDEAMPRSFTAIVEQAEAQQVSICAIEQKNLGLDHTILGKRLAAKWLLPDPIAVAIWLHHAGIEAILQDLPQANIAAIVQLADLIARQCEIGQSGSYDNPDSAALAKSLYINTEHLEHICAGLAEKVEQRCGALELDSANGAGKYCNIFHSLAAQSARKNAQLSQENRELLTASSRLEFVREFLSGLNTNAEPVDVAAGLAACWQKFYQTGVVCVYLTGAGGTQFLNAAVAEEPSRLKTILLKAPSDGPVIPRAIANKFSVLDAAEYCGWLFEQLDINFDQSRAKIVPLLCDGKAAGAIVFELGYPVEPKQLCESLEPTASIAAAVLAMASSRGEQQEFAEQFARLVTRPQVAPPPAEADLSAEAPAKVEGIAAPQEQATQVEAPQVEAPPQETPLPEATEEVIEEDTEDTLEALAEMAAGAAHEMNNPLSVISGRAQMLANTEQDAERKKMLEQIRVNCEELSGIIDDLMTYAEPPKPRPGPTAVKQMLDDAIHLAAQKTGVDHVNYQIEAIDNLPNVFVDPAQLVSALANIICNSLESYPNKDGPVKIAAEADESGRFVTMAISDLGCGMDVETLRKATQPFFSAKPAGRKRGMGLAHAQRTIQLNNGALEIESETDKGTTVTISLPCGAPEAPAGD